MSGYVQLFIWKFAMKKITFALLLSTLLSTSAISFAADTASQSTATSPAIAVSTGQSDAQTNTPTKLNVAAQPAASVVAVGKNAAAYFTIENKGGVPVTVVGVALEPKDLAEKVEFHKTTTDAKGVSSMASVDKIVVPAGSSFAFEKGANHVMIMGLKNPLKSGDKVKLVMTFDDKTTQTIEALVN